MAKFQEYPMRIGLIRDPRVRQAIKIHGNFALMVLIGVYDRIFSDNGYYVNVDNFLYEDIAALILNPDKTEYVKAIIQEYVNNGIFDKKMFERNILTSQDIQRKFKRIVYTTSHRTPKIDEDFLVESDVTRLNPNAKPAEDRVEDEFRDVEVVVDDEPEEKPEVVVPEPVPEPSEPIFDPMERDATEKLFDVPDDVPPVDCEGIIRLFRITLGDYLPKPNDQVISETRKSHIIARDADLSKLNMSWSAYFKKIKDSDFLCGRVPDPRWKADFDWVIQKRNFNKILEGTYDNNKRYGSYQPRYTGMTFEQEIAMMQRENGQ